MGLYARYRRLGRFVSAWGILLTVALFPCALLVERLSLKGPPLGLWLALAAWAIAFTILALVEPQR